MVVWKDIPGFGRYQISNIGQVRKHPNKKVIHGLKPGCLLTPVLDRKHGYIVYCLMDDNNKVCTWYASRFIALAFKGLPPSSKHWALHYDDDKKNNTDKNIYWGLPKHNAIDRVRNGNSYKLSVKQAKSLRNFYIACRNKSATARHFGIDRDTVTRIIENRKYGRKVAKLSIPQGEQDEEDED